MKSGDKRAATAAYKERKAIAGIYALRCTASGQRWVGRAPDLGTIQNRLTFTLGQRASLYRSLQTAWCEHGAEAFTFETVERLEDDGPGYARDRILKDRLAFWRAALGAEAI